MNYNKICTIEEYLEESGTDLEALYQISIKELIDYDDEKIQEIIEKIYREYWDRDMIDTDLFRIEKSFGYHYVRYTDVTLEMKKQGTLLWDKYYCQEEYINKKRTEYKQKEQEEKGQKKELGEEELEKQGQEELEEEEPEKKDQEEELEEEESEKKGQEEQGQEKKEQEKMERIKEGIYNKIKNVLVHYGSELVDDFRYQHYKLLLYSKNNGRYNGSDYKLLLETDFPFIKGEYELPEVGKEFFNIIYGKHYISMLKNFENQDIGTDISRYGIQNIKNLIKEIENSEIIEEEKCLIYIYLEELFGISLTNTIFWSVKECGRGEKEGAIQKDWEMILTISKLLGKIQYVYLRNAIAQIVFGELEVYCYEEEVFNCIESILNESIENINYYMDDVHKVYICSVYKQEEKEDDLENNLVEIKSYLLNEIGEKFRFFSMQEIYEYLGGKKEDESRITIKDFADYFLKDMEENTRVFDIKEVDDYFEKKKGNKSDESKEWRVKISKRIKESKEELYARIHQNVMWGIRESNYI